MKTRDVILLALLSPTLLVLGPVGAWLMFAIWIGFVTWMIRLLWQILDFPA